MSEKNKKWHIIDDDLVKVKRLAESIDGFFPDDTIVWYLPDKIIHKEIEEFQKFFKVDQFIPFNSYSNLLVYFKKNSGEGILLAETSIPGMPDSHGEDQLKEGLQTVLQKVSNSLLCLTTTRRNLVSARKWFDPSLGSRIIIDNYDFEKKYDIQSLIIKLDNTWQELFRKDPLKIFLEKMYSLFSAQQYPGDKNHAHNWTTNETFPPPQLIDLTDFLKISAEKYIDTFKIERRDNPTGECLKVMGTHDKHHLPLLGVVLIAWGAYRHSCKLKNEVNTQFIKIIADLHENYKNPERREETGNFSRYKNMLPAKNYSEYVDTLLSMYSMFTDMFRHNEEDRLLRLKMSPHSITFSIKIENPCILLSHLNESMNHLVLNSRILREHDSVINSGIIEFFLRFHLNSNPLSKSGLKQEFVSFGNNNSFSLKQKGENILDIQFKILNDD
ncbi:MAG: hypothetical protein IH594_10790 [Bacteroidales bacterium]|nr:hypothetical protein [Bacteroidales bacterium]